MKFRTFLVSFLTGLLIASTASALPFDTGYESGGLFNNILHDTSAEYLMTNGDVSVDIGDILAGDILIHRIDNHDIGSGSGEQELTAHFELQVTGKVAESRTITGTTYNGFAYTFGATSNNIQSGEVAWYYTDPSYNSTFSNPSTFSDGDLWASFGFDSTDTAYWTAWTASDNIITLGTLVGTNANGSDYGRFTFGLNVIQNNSSLTFNDVFGQQGIDLTGQGHFTPKSTDYSATYQIGDQADMYINVVPEPASFILFGFGLLGVAGLSRRNRKED